MNNTTTKTRRTLAGHAFAFLLALAAATPLTAEAHRPWLMPSATNLSGDDQWVSVDAAVSTDLFYFDHNPMRLEGLLVTAPNGSMVAPENQSTGKLRSTFDVKLAQPGTYKFAVVGDNTMASFKVGSEVKRVRGNAETLAREIPANAQEVSVVRMQTRTETFVTSGKPNDAVFKPTNVGLELVPISHPNDLVKGSPASFRLLLDGKPAAGVEVVVIPGGIRYRDGIGDMKSTTDADGKFSVSWPVPGMYWINGTTGGSGRATGGTAAAPLRRTAYSAVVEVMPN